MKNLNSLLQLLVVALIFIQSTGCQSDEEKQPSAEDQRSAADRPPLRVLLVDCENIADRLQIRWNGVSEQAIQCTSISRDEMRTQLRENRNSRIPSDVIIYPSYLLGEMVENNSIRGLPGAIANLSESVADLGDREDLRWPIHWRRLCRYGEKCYAVPLGAPLLAWASNSEKAKGTESSDDNPLDEGFASSTLTDDYLIGVFGMLLAVETNPSQTGQFIELATVEPKVASREFALAASQLRELSGAGHLASPDALTAFIAVSSGDSSASFGYTSLVDSNSQTIDDSQFSVGFPNQDFDYSNFSDELQRNRRSSSDFRIFDLGSGLLASVSTSTRQSSVSTRFVEWLDDDTQRVDLANVDHRIHPRGSKLMELTAGSPTSNQYFQQLTAAWNGSPIRIELRSLAAIEMRESLAATLRKIVSTDEPVDKLLLECDRQWRSIIRENGPQFVRRSIERSLQLSN